MLNRVNTREQLEKRRLAGGGKHHRVKKNDFISGQYPDHSVVVILVTTKPFVWANVIAKSDGISQALTLVCRHSSTSSRPGHLLLRK